MDIRPLFHRCRHQVFLVCAAEEIEPRALASRRGLEPRHALGVGRGRVDLRAFDDLPLSPGGFLRPVVRELPNLPAWHLPLVAAPPPPNVPEGPVGERPVVGPGRRALALDLHLPPPPAAGDGVGDVEDVDVVEVFEVPVSPGAPAVDEQIPARLPHRSALARRGGVGDGALRPHQGAQVEDPGVVEERREEVLEHHPPERAIGAWYICKRLGEPRFHSLIRKTEELVDVVSLLVGEQPRHLVAPLLHRDRGLPLPSKDEEVRLGLAVARHQPARRRAPRTGLFHSIRHVIPHPGL
mmetsp:Transcript_54334/g.172572  ORF Transcript_54334/g.172572 Transcript_54334/m.172572 type:complete len:296 (+) Transcript_54334:95-982(+)